MSILPQDRTFGKKTYRFHSWHHFKNNAKDNARRLRQLGYNARVVRIGGRWALYKG